MRRYQVLEWTRAGASALQIVEMLSQQGITISRQQILKDRKRVLQELADAHTEDANKVRGLVLDRYERLLMTWWPRAIQGESVATDKVMSILRAEREIYGLDPDKPMLNLIQNNTIMLKVEYGDSDNATSSIYDQVEATTSATNGVHPESGEAEDH